MEFLIELFGEIFLEGSVSLVHSNKVPKWLRIIIGIILLAFFLLLVGMLFLLGVKLFMDKEYISSLIFFALVTFILIFSIKYIKNTITILITKNNKK